MFSFIKILNYQGENIYDIRLPLTEKDKLLNKYNLNFKYKEKKYYLNNVVITLNPNGNNYNYEEDLSINIENNYIIREYKVKECPIFNFYNTDVEENYRLYSNETGDIILKDFNNYCTFEIITDHKDLKI